MTHEPALSVPTRVELRPRRTGARHASPPSVLEAAVRRRAGSTGASALSQARRAQNRSEPGVVTQLRCECDAPGCRATCPTVADTHRGLLDRFIVTPAHLGASTVVKAADRFFIVELARPGWQ